MHVLSGLPAVALAGAGARPPAGNAETELRLAARAEDEGAFARALEHYGACLEDEPSLRIARNARNRIIWIEERSEGGFVPLATLARVRRDPRALAHPAALEKLAAEVESFPPGRVRSELRLRVAEARLKRDGPHAEALTGLRAVIGDASSGGSDRVLAERDLVTALMAAGRLDEARDEVDAHPFDPSSIAEVARRLRRRSWLRAGGVGAVALLTLALGARRSRRRRRPLLEAHLGAPASRAPT